MKYHIVDVFARERYSGNQLAVVLLQEPMDKELMQRIATEFHFSETTFIAMDESEGNRFRVYIFTPAGEIPFAGHPTLGTAQVIRDEILGGGAKEVVLDLEAGQVPVWFDSDGLVWMRQMEPVFGEEHDRSLIAPIISLDSADIDSRYPIQNVSTGLDFIIVPVKSLRAMKDAAIDPQEYRRHFNTRDRKPLLLFCPETYEKENTLNCRMFDDVHGAFEDPATGSANGCLSAYLSQHQYFGSDSVDISVEQGFEIDRKSILYLRSKPEGASFNIEIGGRVFPVADGTLR